MGNPVYLHTSRICKELLMCLVTPPAGPSGQVLQAACQRISLLLGFSFAVEATTAAKSCSHRHSRHCYSPSFLAAVLFTFCNVICSFI